MGHRPHVLVSLVQRAFKRRGVRALFGAVLLLLVVAGAVYLVGIRDRKKPRPTPGDQTQSPELESTRLLEQLKHEPFWVEHLGDNRQHDWPQYRGPRRDGIVRGVELLPDWSVRKPQVLWEQPCGGGYSSVVVSGGRAYLLDRPRAEDQERIVCLDAGSGRELWSRTFPADYSRIPAAGRDAGPLATPTVHGDRLYGLGATGHLVCLKLGDTDSGPTVAWEHDLPAEFEAELPPWGLACSPLIVDDLVVVQPGGRRGSIAAFDRVSGERRWSTLEDVNGYASPVLAAPAGVRQIIALTQGRLVGLHPETGAYLWHYPWRESVATPLVSGDYAFITCDHGSALVKLEPVGGSLRAKRVFECGGEVLESHVSTPVVKDGYAYGFHGDPYKARGAKLTCVDLRDPSGPRWQTDEVVNGQLLRFGDVLVVQTHDGDLVLVQATPDRFRLLGKMQGVLAGGRAWAPPAVVGNHLYVRDQEKVVCLELPVGL